jgi:hypothetical protein
MSTNKALIVLQENSGRVELPDAAPAPLRDTIYSVIDSLAETFEDIKTTLQAATRYDVVHLLTDNLCSRSQSLNALVIETQRKRTIDLIILGHGSNENLIMKRRPNLSGGPNGNIRSLLTDARSRGVNKLSLRMVYMCNCYGSTLNDDWEAIGAQASVGSKLNDYMPEPMTTFFIHNWLGGQKVNDAAKNAYQATVPFYMVVYPPTTKIRYKIVKVSYPCPTLTDPLKMCDMDMQLPDGVDLKTNSKIVETELKVGGNGNIVF